MFSKYEDNFFLIKRDYPGHESFSSASLKPV